jgi:hypothetical protein
MARLPAVAAAAAAAAAAACRHLIIAPRFKSSDRVRVTLILLGNLLKCSRLLRPSICGAAILGGERLDRVRVDVGSPDSGRSLPNVPFVSTRTYSATEVPKNSLHNNAN